MKIQFGTTITSRFPLYIYWEAAVDDEEISKDNNDITSDPMNAYSVKAAYGEAVEDEVDKFYNLRSSEDNCT